jgi:isocitrate dehydrogenase kinase/phosphatase
MRRRDYGMAIKEPRRSTSSPIPAVQELSPLRARHVPTTTIGTDCRFRTIPETPEGVDDMSDEVWYPVGPHDVFPEEFATFLLTDPEVRRAFLAFHADLLDARWWQAMQDANRDGRQIEVLSYPESIRFRRKAARPRYSIA